MDLDLEDKVAVVTGAGRGIGLAIARGLAGAGARVVAGSKTVTDELAALTADSGATAVALDLTAPDAPQQLLAAAGTDRLDILVNNVGGAPARLDGFAAITDEMWQRTLDLNLLTTVRMIRAALPLLLAGPASAIVNVSSINGRLPDPAVLDYSAAKAALDNLGKSLSKEFGGRGLRVNSVDPGPVATDLWLGAGGVAQTIAAHSGASPDDIAAGAAAGMPTGRFSRPDEVADLVLFLASARAANITGAGFVIDGGMAPMLF